MRFVLKVLFRYCIINESPQTYKQKFLLAFLFQKVNFSLILTNSKLCHIDILRNSIEVACNRLVHFNQLSQYKFHSYTLGSRARTHTHNSKYHNKNWTPHKGLKLDLFTYQPNALPLSHLCGLCILFTINTLTLKNNEVKFN